jgi:mannose-6-phosphate isomerase-like protein (cupin superfamily)
MKKFRLSSLRDTIDGHFLQDTIPGKYLSKGGLGFKKPGFRTHSNDGPDRSNHHVHDDDYEVFIILQGKAVMEINDKKIPLVTGDICIIEPGENHHLIADKGDPCVNLWLHAGPERHQDQEV